MTTPAEQRAAARLWSIVQSAVHGYGAATLFRSVCTAHNVYSKDRTWHFGAVSARLYAPVAGEPAWAERLEVWVGTFTPSGMWVPQDLYVCFGRDPWALHLAVPPHTPPPRWVPYHLFNWAAHAPDQSP
jgi:hypothetical protein